MTIRHQVLRVFEVRAKPNCTDILKQKLSDTSVAVVKGKPGNRGYYFGELQDSDTGDLVFISIWSASNAIKRYFGNNWSISFLPDGYEDLIETCSVKHYRVTGEVVD